MNHRTVPPYTSILSSLRHLRVSSSCRTRTEETVDGSNVRIRLFLRDGSSLSITAAPYYGSHKGYETSKLKSKDFGRCNVPILPPPRREKQERTLNHPGRGDPESRAKEMRAS